MKAKVKLQVIDDVTYGANIICECPECGHPQSIFDPAQEPFKPSSALMVIPLLCNSCRYSYSLNIELDTL